ncbi:hypothetical protein ACN42_g8505 [Penicillium freii]|uniref:Uncharacterized protein n=1 Tax=Penicillium freii TaxID=48697 RepID=A0A117NM61_PENFR|nr:hypothetical protein ACN42_g8505 [Penicillium freii]
MTPSTFHRGHLPPWSPSTMVTFHHGPSIMTPIYYRPSPTMDLHLLWTFTYYGPSPTMDLPPWTHAPWTFHLCHASRHTSSTMTTFLVTFIPSPSTSTIHINYLQHSIIQFNRPIQSTNQSTVYCNHPSTLTMQPLQLSIHFNHPSTSTIHLNHPIQSTVHFSYPSTSIIRPLQLSTSIIVSSRFNQLSTSINQFNQPFTSVIHPLQSSIHFNHLSTSVIRLLQLSTSIIISSRFSHPSTSIIRPLQSSVHFRHLSTSDICPLQSSVHFNQPSTSIIQFNQLFTSINCSPNHFNHPSNSITTSLTVAGFGFRTIGRLVNQHSMNHLDQLPTSNTPLPRSIASSTKLTSLTVAGFGFRTIGRLVNYLPR